MSTPLTTAAWNSPATLTSMEVLTSGLWNNLSKDVGYLYAKPWLKAWATANIAVSLAGATPAWTTATSLILGAGSSSLGNTPATYASITNSAGVITLPSNVPGLYRVTAQAMIATGATAHVRLVANTQDAGGSVGMVTIGQFATQITQANTAATLDFIIPLGSSINPTTKNKLYVKAQAVAAATTVLANDQAATPQGPGSTPPVYNTFVIVEYLGTSFGSFAN